MKVKLKLPHNYFRWIQTFLIYFWLVNLYGTDAFYSVYVLCAVISICCLRDFEAMRDSLTVSNASVNVCGGVFFSLATFLANYNLFVPFISTLNLCKIAGSVLGGYCVGSSIMQWLTGRLPIQLNTDRNKFVLSVFGVSFLTVLIPSLLYLYFCAYPGIIAYDTFASFNQILGYSVYDNRMPYWFTKTLWLFWNVGFSFFDDINTVILFYTSCQCVFIAACFAYVVVSIYQFGVSCAFVILTLMLYAFLPYNIVFNVTIGKDILFGVALLLMTTALFRILNDIGKNKILNYVVFAFGTILFCLWRTNGWYAYAVISCVSFFAVRKKYPKLVGLMCTLCFFCWLLLNPFFTLFNIRGTDYIEAMAVPFQQVSQVVSRERDVSPEDEELLSQAFDLDVVREKYTPGHVDVIKYEAMIDRTYFLDHLEEYFALWIRLGLRYPDEYFSSWIDQTKGYWNSGYHMGVNDRGIKDNDLGIVYTGGENILSKVFGSWYSFCDRIPILDFLKASGFIVWLVLCCFAINISQRRNTTILIIPALVLIVGLWVGTPVAAEFRYIYPICVTSPLLCMATAFVKK